MTTACTRCGAATADHMLTTISKMRREVERNVQQAALCPRCYATWWRLETEAAVSLEQHLGRPGPKRGA